MRGICRLHQEEDELKDSHILPRWAWKRALKSHSDPRVGRVNGGTFTDTGEQVTEHLLCSSCEQQLGVWDDYVSQVSRQPDGSFPARDRGLPTPTRDLPAGVAAIVDASALNVSAISAFASSVVWRASVSSKCEARLGPKYDEEFAYYLRAAAQFPESARLFLYLIDTKGTSGADEIFCLPISRRVDGDSTMHEFFVFGMHFMLLVGDRLPRAYDDCCLVRTQRAWIGRPQSLVADSWHRVVSAMPKGDRATRMWRQAQRQR